MEQIARNIEEIHRSEVILSMNLKFYHNKILRDVYGNRSDGKFKFHVN